MYWPALSRDGPGGFSLTAPALAALSRLQRNSSRKINYLPQILRFLDCMRKREELWGRHWRNIFDRKFILGELRLGSDFTKLNENDRSIFKQNTPRLCPNGPHRLGPRSVGPPSATGPLSGGCRRVRGRSVPWRLTRGWRCARRSWLILQKQINKRLC